MALLRQSVQVSAKLGELFAKLRDGQAPEKFTRGFLADLGLKSSNWHASIPLLKGLGLLSAEGSPTRQYMELLDETRWRTVLGRAVREAYSDIFVMKREPTHKDVKMIAGKYKTTYNMSEVAAERAARTFLALLALCDMDSLQGEIGSEASPQDHKVSEESGEAPTKTPPQTTSTPRVLATPKEVGLNYNIQIHLPATKDVAVYNAIFKSLREHIIV